MFSLQGLISDPPVSGVRCDRYRRLTCTGMLFRTLYMLALGGPLGLTSTFNDSDLRKVR